MGNAIIGKLGEDGEIKPVELNPDKAEQHINKLKQVVADAEEAGKNLTEEDLTARVHASKLYVNQAQTIVEGPPEEK